MNKEMQEILMAEVKRLQRMNEYLEEHVKGEPERIAQNALAINEISKSIL